MQNIVILDLSKSATEPPIPREVEQECHVLLSSEAPDESWFLLASRMPWFLPIENRTKEENEHESDCC